MGRIRLTAWDWFKMVVGTVVVSVWAYLLVVTDGHVDYLVHVVMLTVVGALFGSPLAALREVLKGEHRDDPSPR